MNHKTITDSRIKHEGKVMQGDLNRYGLMHGGRLLTLCDEVGYLSAMKHTGCDCLTRAVHDVQFLSMMKEGDSYTVESQVVLTGNTTLWTTCTVILEGKTVMHAVFVYIAIDKNFKSQPVEPIHAESEAEQIEQRRMQALIDQVTP